MQFPPNGNRVVCLCYDDSGKLRQYVLVNVVQLIRLVASDDAASLLSRKRRQVAVGAEVRRRMIVFFHGLVLGSKPAIVSGVALDPADQSIIYSLSNGSNLCSLGSARRGVSFGDRTLCLDVSSRLESP